MKKTELRKLSLNRETVMPLQDDQLQHVNGGNVISAVSRASVRWCSQVSRWVSKQVSIASAVEVSQETIRRTAGGGGGGGGQ
ncbi:MAG: class I lanthipeptide [Deltaproteobacteria bacterium]|nr:class I lanthipeptide [Deltaproteobacteria bacterium]